MPKQSSHRLKAKQSKRNSYARRRLSVESLEPRRLLATDFLVVNTADSGAGSLRSAIQAANNHTGDARIVFQIPTTDTGFVDSDAAISGGDAGKDVFRIRPLTQLPKLQNNHSFSFSIVIDGTTQTVATGNTNALGPEIELDGSLATGTWGLELGSKSQLIGLNVHSFDSAGLRIVGGYTSVLGSYIGTDPTGTLGRGNSIGIEIAKGGQDGEVTIGGPNAVDRNLISGNNAEGIFELFFDASEGGGASSDLHIENNYIGTNRTGDATLGNSGIGVRLERTLGATVKNNLISGNGSHGLFGYAVFGLTATGNKIGTNAAGTAGIGNGEHGIVLIDSVTVTIGGVAESDRNLVSGNTQLGIRLLPGNDFVFIENNYVGVNANGSAGIANGSGGIAVSGSNIDVINNLISGNQGIGLDIHEILNLQVRGNRIGTNRDGTLAVGNSRAGITVYSGRDVRIGGTTPSDGNIVSGNQTGMDLRGDGGEISVIGNFIGTNVTGIAAIPNLHSGIVLHPDSHNYTIGGATELEGNLISGNSQQGIFVWESYQATVQNNRIGVQADGISPLPNLGEGVDVGGGRQVNVWANTISNNGREGVAVRASTEDGLGSRAGLVQWNSSVGGNDHYYLLMPPLNWLNANQLAGQLGGYLADVLSADENSFLHATLGISDNWIGLSDHASEGVYAWTSGAPLGYWGFVPSAPPNGGTSENFVELVTDGTWNDLGSNHERRGIVEFSTPPDMALLRSKLSGVKVENNRISNNGGDGVVVTAFNEVPVTIKGNAIFANGDLGIDLNRDGRTNNDVGDTDTGPNSRQNYPVLFIDTSVSPAVMRGTLNSQPNSTFTIELFLNATAEDLDAEGQMLIHSTSVTTDAAGNATFTIPRQPSGTVGLITATATNAAGETSEFSLPSNILTNGPELSLFVEGKLLPEGADFAIGATQPGVARTRTLTVINTGDEPLVVQPVVAPAGFSLLSNFTTNQVILPGGSADLIVQFNATAEGSLTGVFFIETNINLGDEFYAFRPVKVGGTAIAKLSLLKDLHPGLANSTPNSMIVFDNSVYFLADDGVHGEELWKTDGTVSGTVLVKDVNPGLDSSYIAGLSVVNGKLVFSAYTESSGEQLWKSDGTESGTQILKDFGTNGSAFMVHGSGPNLRDASSPTAVYFYANDNSGFGAELWKTDGTLAGTVMVKDINPGANGSFPRSFHTVGPITFFSASDGTSGRELWRTDGTTDGTYRVIDAAPGTASGAGVGAFLRLATVNGKVLARLNNGTAGTELWISDGASAGTQLLKDIFPGSSSSNPQFLDTIGNQLLFYANNGIHGNELWITNGTATGTKLLKDINPGAADGLFSVVSQDAGNKVYFFADGGVHGRELWVSDGTAIGTRQMFDLNPGAANAVTDLRGMTRLGNKLIFGGNDGRVGEELWILDISEPDKTRPTSKVDALPSRATSKSFTVRVTGQDPASTNPVETVSGVASYDIFVAEGSGSYRKLGTVPASSPQLTFNGRSNTTYFFRSVARDVAGNIESKTIVAEAQIYVPDLDAPTTRVESVNSTTANFQLMVRGTDAGGGTVNRFKVYASVDGGTPVMIAEVNAGQPDSSGVQRASLNYQAIADGTSHSYRFYSVGVDQAGNTEANKSSGDLTVQKTFAAATQLAATGIDVQNGQSQRSYIRNVDILFNTDSGLLSVINSLNDGSTTNDRLKLQRFGLDGGGTGVDVNLNGLASQNGRSLKLDFGAQGLGGNRGSAVGNGYYRLSVDADGNGSVDQVFHFYRLLGDTTGDKIVNSLDVGNIALAISSKLYDPNWDVNGDGVVNLTDRNLASGQLNKALAGNLPLDD